MLSQVTSAAVGFGASTIADGMIDGEPK
jgi:hypothetical protein